MKYFRMLESHMEGCQHYDPFWDSTMFDWEQPPKNIFRNHHIPAQALGLQVFTTTAAVKTFQSRALYGVWM